MSGYIGTQPVPQATQTRDSFTATASQTSFATGGYTPQFLDVYLNGVHLLNGTDYTATNGSDVVLTTGAAAGDVLEVVSYTAFEAANVTGATDFTVTGSFTSRGIDDNASSTAITIDGSQNVGIGTASPSAELDTLGVIRTSNTVDSSYYGTFSNPDGLTRIQAFGGGTSIAMSTSGSERMRLDASGNLLVGKTVANTTTEGVWIDGPNGRLFATADDDYTAQFTRNGSDGVLVYWYNDTAQAGTITISGSSCSYNTSSDYRLKTDAQQMTGASARVQALNPVNFEWIADGTRVDGFLAHEAQAVVPEAVTGTKDAMRDEEYEVTPAVLDNDGNVVTEAVMGTRSVPDYQGIDQSKIVPLLTAALQEALTKIDDMETRLAALENKP